jgi:hypothetical protein
MPESHRLLSFLIGHISSSSTVSRFILRVSAIFLLGVVGLASCSCGGPAFGFAENDGIRVLARIVVTPLSTQILVGGTQYYSATALDANDVPISGVSFTWSSDATQVGTVNSSGVATGIAAGSAHITASAQGVRGSATLIVHQRSVGSSTKVASVSVTPLSAQILVGGTQQFSATAYDANGVAISGISFTWSSDATQVGTVNSSGVATGIAAATLFGLTENNFQLNDFPSVSFGTYRFLDSAGTAWAEINLKSGSYNWTSLDNMLAQLLQHGVSAVLYSVGNIPTWAANTSHDPYAGVRCAYTKWFGPGSCDPPLGLNLDGTGDNLIWRTWVAAIAIHVAGLNPAKYAHIEYWEPWNEVDRSTFLGVSTGSYSFEGTYAQLVRMVQDERCIIKGNLGGNQTQEVSGGDTCEDVLNSVADVLNCEVGSCQPTDSSATIVMPSAHTNRPNYLYVAKNFLYCSVPDWPNPNSCIAGTTAGADAVDIIDFHMKYPTGPPENFLVEMATAKSLLQHAELAKPFINGESGYGPNTTWTDPDMQASYVGRYYIIQASAGVPMSNWYTWDEPGNSLWSLSNGIFPAGVAYGQLYAWLVGATMVMPCSNQGTIWICGLARENPPSYQAESIWDTDFQYTCNAGICPTHSVAVPSMYLQYRDLAGNKDLIQGGEVPIGAKPILLENQ